MKKLLILAATAVFFASCGNNQQATDQANQAKLDSMSRELARQHIVDSMNAAIAANAEAEAAASATQPQRTSTRTHSASYSNSTAPNRSGAEPSVATTAKGPTAAEIEAKRKADNRKKAKSAATGAVIGAGAGAIGGAISGKNDHFKKENAAIGAGVGAAVGAGAGLLLQNRKLKKEKEAAETPE